ncbi:MAG: hypothetical protein LBG91_01295 [Treponema sp.]|nr:hypothetical protein [Treponema sp.]
MTKKCLLKAAAVLVLVLAAFLFSCDLPAADAQLDGAWIAVSGAQLEFSSGKFTKTPVIGGVETGTFTISEGYITFNRAGFTPETLPYKLESTRLTVGATVYYRNSLGVPDEVEGRWTPYPDYGTALTFLEGKPQKGNAGIIEGIFINSMGGKGIYTISNRNVPGSNKLTSVTTHIHGSSMANFVEERLRISILELFDLALLEPPPYSGEDWWFTVQEARNFFENAAGRAPNLEDQAVIILAMEFFFDNFADQTYDYTLEEDINLNYDYNNVATGKNKLTLRGYGYFGPYIFTYMKLKDSFGDIEQGPGATPNPVNPWQPF